MNKMDVALNVKTTQLCEGVRLVGNPQVITVQTISKKIVEQMAWLDGEPGAIDKQVDLTGIMVLGAMEPYGTLIVMDKEAHLWRLRGSAYTWWRSRSGGVTIDAANAEIKGLPQLFTH